MSIETQEVGQPSFIIRLICVNLCWLDTPSKKNEKRASIIESESTRKQQIGFKMFNILLEWKVRERNMR